MTKTYQQSQTLEDRLTAAESKVAGKNSVNFMDYIDDVTADPGMIGKLVRVTKGTAVTLTLPKDSDSPGFQIGDSFEVTQGGAGALTVAAGSGATLRKAAATAKILAQYGIARVRKIGPDTWSLNGELAAS